MASTPLVSPGSWPSLVARRAGELALPPPAVELVPGTARLVIGRLEWAAAAVPIAAAERIAEHLLLAAQALGLQPGLWHMGARRQRLRELVRSPEGAAVAVHLEEDRIVFGRQTWAWISSHEQGWLFDPIGWAPIASLPHSQVGLESFVEHLTEAALAMLVPADSSRSLTCRHCGATGAFELDGVPVCDRCAEHHLHVVF